MTRDDLIHKARQDMEDARKKLQGNAGAESAFAGAYARLCQLDPATYRPLRKKYR